MIKAVFFDFDGTLCNSGPGIFKCALGTMKELGYDVSKYTEKELRKFVGPPLADCFRIVFNPPEEKIDECIKIYRELYVKFGIDMMEPYEGIKETLIELKALGILTSVATNKKRNLANECLRRQGLFEYFDYVSGPEDDGSMTKTEVIDKARKILKLEKDEVLMVGDTVNDQKGAESAGVHFLPVTWGFGFSPANYPREYKAVNKPEEIITIVKEERR